MRIVVTGLIAAYPLGGVAWDYLQYVHGLRALGHEVLYLEDTGRWVYAPWDEALTDDCDRHVAYLAAVFRGGEPWAFRDPRGRMHGMDVAAVRRACGEADLFLNVSGACWLRDEYRGRGITAYVDTDPGYSQSVLLAAAEPSAPEAVRYAAALIRAHDVFFTFAENIGEARCAVPTAGLRWLPTRHPIVLDDWPRSPVPAEISTPDPSRARAFTTVMSWRAASPLPVLGGRTYGGKDVEVRKLAELPRRVRVPLELAVAGDAPRRELTDAGWRLIDARSVSSTPEDYRDYLARSRGEIGIAKEVYVATASGWFSSRSASYLALGRPVIVQDTGLEERHPCGRGLLTFRDVDTAVAAIDDVLGAYGAHARDARALAGAQFDARRVLARLLDDVFAA